MCFIFRNVVICLKFTTTLDIPRWNDRAHVHMWLYVSVVTCVHILTRQLRRRKHEETVRKQISEKEKQAIESRKAFFEEGARLDQEAQQRRQRLDEIKQRKLAELEVRRCHFFSPLTCLSVPSVPQTGVSLCCS